MYVRTEHVTQCSNLTFIPVLYCVKFLNLDGTLMFEKSTRQLACTVIAATAKK